jgi:acyl carrier protein
MGDVDSVLAVMWRGLLELDDVTAESDFIDCGGTSILAVHLAALIQEKFAVSLDAIDVVVLRRFDSISRSIQEKLAQHSL